MSTLGRAARLIDRTGLGRVLRRLGTWRGALVLTYHRMYRPGASPHAEPRLWSATQEELDAQLSLLAREFDVVPARELGEGITSARGRVVVLTFDDGFRDNWELALPVLRSRGVPATFFLATGFIDDPRLAWWDELAWMVHKARNATMCLARIPREL